MPEAPSNRIRKRQPRRVPQERRQRAVQSCDLCRRRRCKCVPTIDGASCVVCQDLKLPCLFTASRKTRYTGSWEDLSDRYRCLDTIVQGAFPNHATANTGDLIELGHSLGLQMPDISNDTERIPMESLVREPDPQVSSSYQVEEFQNNHSDTEEESTPLFRDDAGKEHYIGPSGTISFLSELRRVFISSSSRPPSRHLAWKASQTETTQTLEAGTEVSLDLNQDAAPSLDDASPNSATTTNLQHAHPSESEFVTILSQLPSSETLDLLVHAYFKTLHEDFPLFNQSSFECQYEVFITQARRRLHLSQLRSPELPDWGWIGCLYMIMVFGSISNPHIGNILHMELQRDYLCAARALVPHIVSRCTLTNVQALLLLSLWLNNNSERNVAWNLTGTAVRVGYAIGLHQTYCGPVSSTLSAKKSSDLGNPSIRWMVWTTLYGFDLFLASSLGRPSALRREDVQHVIQQLERLSPQEITMIRNPSILEEMFKLNQVLAKTLQIPGGLRDQLHPANTARRATILHDLDAWKVNFASRHPQFNVCAIELNGVSGLIQSDLPTLSYEETEFKLSGKTRSHIRASLLINLQYHYVALLITRSSLLQEIAAVPLHNECIWTQFHTLTKACIFHAHQTSYILLLMNGLQVLHGKSGMEMFCAYWAGMLLNLLRLRQVPKSHLEESGTNPNGQNFVHEPNFETLRQLIAKVHQIILSTPKSGTMHRLAAVMTTFIEWADSTSMDSLSNASATAQVGELDQMEAPSALELLDQPYRHPEADTSIDVNSSRQTNTSGAQSYSIHPDSIFNFWSCPELVGLAPSPESALSYLPSHADDPSFMFGPVGIDESMHMTYQTMRRN